MTIKAAHHPGRHCASTGIRNLVNYHRLPWSEALCFGLGAGLGFWYLDLPGLSPSRLIHVRAADLEERFFNRIGCPFAWERFADPVLAEEALCERVAAGLPAIVQTDIYYLPYYRSSTHFPGHLITVWGCDRLKRVFWVTDTEREAVLPVSFEDMRRARHCRGGIYDLAGNMFGPESLKAPENMSSVIREAISFNSRMMLEDVDGYQGTAALARWIDAVQTWRDLEDWSWTARFTYQVIERRGTGGGGFRLLYADFLQEAAAFYPAVDSAGLRQLMLEAAAAWRELALAFKTASEAQTFKPETVSPLIERVYRLELNYHQTVLATLAISRP
ncbi:MAG: BtrH N-terminal domain-containing protein [Bacillota bacterium]